MVTAYVMHRTHGKKQCNDLQTYIYCMDRTWY